MPTLPVLSDRPPPVFRDRREAGRALAALLEHYRGDETVVVLGLARGGVPVAWEIAAALAAPLDVLVVRALRAPGRPELVIGALAPDGRVVVNDDMVRGLRLTAEQVRTAARDAAAELPRDRATCRGDRAPAALAGRTVIVVDDGSSTGATLFAAIDAVRAAEPAHLVVAVPAAPESTCREVRGLADDMVCATMPSPFLAVDAAFWDFTQVGAEEVRQLAAPTTGAGCRPIRSRPCAGPRSPHRRASRPATCWTSWSATRVSFSSGKARTAPTSSMRRGPPSPAGCSPSTASMPLRWKRIGPTPTASTVSCAARARTEPLTRRCAASSVSRPGCGATRWCATSSAGCA